MKPMVFALKRFVRRPLFVCMLILYVFLVVLAGGIEANVSMPAAGVFDDSKTAESKRIVAHLTGNGFVECDDPDDMIAQVRDGQLDCAVILPENLVEWMEKNDLDARVPWITSPTSFVPELYKDHVAAALFREYAPHLTAPLFEGTAVPREEIFREYEAMFRDGYAFSFDVVVTEDSSNTTEAKQSSLIVGVSSILLCAVVFAFCADLADTSFRETVGRIGLAKAIAGVLVPGLAVRVLLAGCAGCLGLLLTKSFEWMAALLIYVFVLAGIGLILSGLLYRVRYIYTLLSIAVSVLFKYSMMRYQLAKDSTSIHLETVAQLLFLSASAAVSTTSAM